VQNNTQITVKTETGSRIPIYGERLFFKNGSSDIAAVNRDISTKFGLLIDFDLPKACDINKYERK